MRFLKRNISFLIVCFSISLLSAQNEIIPREGYSPQIGIMVDMLEELKDLITADVQGLSQEQTDFLFDDEANSIGAIIMHIAATESYIQVETLEERVWTPDEAEFFGIAGGLSMESREKLRGKPISYYLAVWNEVRNKTLEGFKARDDVWFAANIDEGMNNHWAWFHILKHTANHMGQIALVKSRLPK
ncbi:DUF664 domain-containing protein [Allomuricauda sp. SCSIO 65647]|uniref:mycothiol transferase n=1 Tax=Allomuricauda sp. SCSIO 65647 TaxID=2908843 RepID=UPI001F2EF8ED|nr:DUF664 domain-containing protein [Muricauda sp. SCSIO 65647]UJH67684.1 DinB family protein [Muricauda sp. SCSIO 65647]